MNNYPSWWDTTITLFNRYEDPLTQLVTWYKTTIEGCFWKNVHDKVKVGEVVFETDGIICRIRKDDRFVDTETWLAMPEDIKAKHFTLNLKDIAIQDNIDETINEYVSGFRSTDILAKYKKLQKCLEVEQFADNTGVGRGNEHYFIKGI